MSIDLTDLWRELLAGNPVLERRPDYRFDPDHYAAADPALGSDPTVLAKHFKDHGKAEGRFPTRYRQLRASNPTLGAKVRRLVTDPRIREAFAEQPFRATELAFELMRLGHDAAISNFSADYYLRVNTDVAQAGVQPLEHYLLHGIHEHRRSLGQLRQNQRRGEMAYDPDRPTVLIALHELSNTGAPHVGLDLATEASATHNVIVAALRPGALLDRFLKVSSSVIITPNPHADFDYFIGGEIATIDLAICNSVESSAFVKTMVARGVPFVSYIHEYTQYTFPTYKTMHTALFADVLAFTSEHVRDSWRSTLTDIAFDVDEESVIVPQRPLVEGSVPEERRQSARQRLSEMIGRDCSDLRIVCGAGHVQWRKGTDIFAMAAQIARHRDPETVFVWVGDGLNREDTMFGAWMTHHLSEAGAGDPAGNLFMLPAGDHYLDVMAAADVFLLSSRLDPLPNVVFDALTHGCGVVLFEGASGFTDEDYRASERMHFVEYGNPEEAAAAALAAPLKGTLTGAEAADAAQPAGVFARLRGELERVLRRRPQVEAVPSLDVPILFGGEEDAQALRERERTRLRASGRQFLWQSAEEAVEVLAASDNWVHRRMSVAPHAEAEVSELPVFNVHLHAFYVGDLPGQLDSHVALRSASRIVVTTDTRDKRDQIEALLAARGLPGEVRVTPNVGRDIVPFIDLFGADGPGRAGEIWGHFHQKKSLTSTDGGDVWREFMTAILLGGPERPSAALPTIARDGVGLVAPFDPHVGQWNASRALLPHLQASLDGPLPDNPLLYPIGNMFWVKGEVACEMRRLFPEGYPWPNEPIPNDGTEFHLIERLWPVAAAQCDLASVFVSKPDQRRRL